MDLLKVATLAVVSFKAAARMGFPPLDVRSPAILIGFVM